MVSACPSYYRDNMLGKSIIEEGFISAHCGVCQSIMVGKAWQLEGALVGLVVLL